MLQKSCSLCTYQLKSRPPLPYPETRSGNVGDLIAFESKFAQGGGGFLRISMTNFTLSGTEVGIWLVPSFLVVYCTWTPFWRSCFHCIKTTSKQDFEGMFTHVMCLSTVYLILLDHPFAVSFVFTVDWIQNPLNYFDHSPIYPTVVPCPSNYFQILVPCVDCHIGNKLCPCHRLKCLFNV